MKTTLDKKKDGWEAKTVIHLDGNHEDGSKVLHITTSKSYNGLLTTTATVYKIDGAFLSHAAALGDKAWGDFYKALQRDKVRCTEKSVDAQHRVALESLDAIQAEIKAHYAKQVPA